MTVEKSSVAREMKTREGRENFPTKILRPLTPSGEMILRVPVSQPRKMVTNTWQMVGSRSSRLTPSPSPSPGSPVSCVRFVVRLELMMSISASIQHW